MRLWSIPRSTLVVLAKLRPTRINRGIQNRHFHCCLIFVGILAGWVWSSYGAKADTVRPTNARQILDLGLEAVAKSPQTVSFSGIVTCPLGGVPWIYVQDETAGMLVLYTNRGSVFRAGQRVDIVGTTYAGQFAVHVVGADVRVRGEGSLPEPKVAEARRLAAGEDFGHWVRLTGRVVDVYRVGNTAVLRVNSGRHRFSVHGPTREFGAIPAPDTIPLEWLDARIEVSGICWTEVDASNRPYQFRIHTPEARWVRILEPGNADLFDRETVAIDQVQAGHPPELPRVKVRGTVTHFIPGERVFLRDATGSLRARVIPELGRSDAGQFFRRRDHLVPLRPGDVVEVVGHGVAAGPSTNLMDAEYRRVGGDTSPMPVAVAVAAFRAGVHDNQLVTLTARLVDRRPLVWGDQVEDVLWLSDGEGTFPASLRTKPGSAFGRFATNSLLQVTGVCLMSVGEDGAYSTPTLLLRSAEDVSLAREPLPWERLPPGRILLVSGVLGMAAVGWIGVLRRQVQQREVAEERARRGEIATRTMSAFATSLLARNSEEEILWDLAQNCVSRLGFTDCVIYLLDERKGVLTQNAAFGPKNPGGREIRDPIALPLGRGIVGSVAATGRPELIKDTRGDQRYIVDDERRLSELAVPIVADGRVLGVIDSEHPQAGFFTEDHLEVLTSIASLCANKLVRVRAETRLRELNLELEQRIEDRTQELVIINQQMRGEINERARAEQVQKALFEISEAVHAVADLPSLYARLHAIIGTLMRADNFYIALLDEATGLVSFPYHRDLVDPPPKPRQRGRGMTEYVLRTGRSSLADLHEIQRLKEAGEYQQSGHPSAIWLGVPLTVAGRTFGVMAVQDQKDPGAFGPEEKRILEFVAGQTALAIERKRRAEDLVRALGRERELSELKGRFVSLVSHEFRTPLGIILSSAEILDAYLHRMTPEERQENVNDILQATRHMARLVENVLLLGRGEAGRLTCQPEAADLESACRRFVEDVSAATHHRCPLQLILPPVIGPARFDEGILRHIFTNLLDNAVKYSPAGTPVEFLVEARPPWAVLTVRDSGRGIPEADRPQLFQAFHRGSNVGNVPGSGLGLVIVKYCVQLQGGRVELTSAPGTGTCATVFLPILGPLMSPGMDPELAGTVEGVS